MSAVAVVAFLVVLHAAFSRRLRRRPVTAPMLFLLAGVALGDHGIGLVTGIGEAVLEPLAELTLVLILFADAARLDLTRLRSHVGLPGRLLGVGLPLVVLLGAGAGALLLDGVGGWTLLVLGAVMAPTDAALAQAVISDERVPGRVRQALNVESGLNDGLVLPVVTIGMAAAAGGLQGFGGGLQFVVQQLGSAVVVAGVVGVGGARLVDARVSAGDMGPGAQQLTTLALAVGAWAVTVAVGGSGFVAAFGTGLVFGARLPQHCDKAQEFTEEEGQLLTLLTFLVVGATLVGPTLANATPRVVAYALVSLTVVRFVPVALSLVGAGLRPATIGFLGWFGPRGLATLVFGLLVVREGGVPGAEHVLDVAVLTVTLSVFLHGISAAPAAGRYGARMATLDAEAAERRPVPDLNPRERWS